jgi:hypothetical protein
MLAGEVKRTTDGGESPTLAALGLASQKVVMYFQADRTELRVMEGFSFYTLRCVD